MFSCDIKNAIEKAVTFVLSNPIFFLKAKALSKYALKKKKKRKETKRRRKKNENRRKVEIMNIRYHAIASIRNENK